MKKKHNKKKVYTDAQLTALLKKSVSCHKFLKK